jgi:hypothetical protein
MKFRYSYVLLLLSFNAVPCETELVQKGSYEVYCDGALVSPHNTYRKAIQVAINKNSDCYIIAPKLVVRGLSLPPDIDPPVITNNNIELTWDIPSSREDDSVLLPTEIKHYVIYYGTDENSLDSMIIVDGLTTIITLDPGVWYFAISTVDSDGLEGRKSNTISQVLP